MSDNERRTKDAMTQWLAENQRRSQAGEELLPAPNLDENGDPVA